MTRKEINQAEWSNPKTGLGPNGASCISADETYAHGFQSGTRLLGGRSTWETPVEPFALSEL